jgi:hypothetical protein
LSGKPATHSVGSPKKPVLSAWLFDGGDSEKEEDIPISSHKVLVEDSDKYKTPPQLLRGGNKTSPMKTPTRWLNAASHTSPKKLPSQVGPTSSPLKATVFYGDSLVISGVNNTFSLIMQVILSYNKQISLTWLWMKEKMILLLQAQASKTLLRP